MDIATSASFNAVWSRIDADTMTAKPLSFYKNKLCEVSRQLYLENGWQMPRGLADTKNRDRAISLLPSGSKPNGSGNTPASLRG